MKVKNIGDSKFLVVLQKGDDLIESLKYFHKNYADKKFCKLDGIGAVEDPTIGYLKDNGEYLFKTMKGEWEILSAKGNLTTFKDDSVAHVHVVLSDIDMKCYGGHLQSAKVSVTIEFVIRVYNQNIIRKRDEEIGINLISI